MDIFINDRPADITLDTEKTLGDVLSGIELWVSSSGSRIMAISLDGQALPGDALSAVFDKDVNEVKKLDITVSAYRDLATEAFGLLLATCEFYRDASFEERPPIVQAWEQSAAAHFLQTDISDVYDSAARTFSGEGLPVTDIITLAEERLREILNPALEISGCEELVKSITERMERLPLDMQTGKDQLAAETMQLFTKACEKLFRIFFVLESEGFSLNSIVVDEITVRAFIEEFNAALTEISAAYANRDTVLVGDLSEYELAPRLLKFYSALKNFSEKTL